MFWPAGPAILGQTWRANHMFEVGAWPVGPATLGDISKVILSSLSFEKKKKNRKSLAISLFMDIAS
jgi:hypothetical protein